MRAGAIGDGDIAAVAPQSTETHITQPDATVTVLCHQRDNGPVSHHSTLPAFLLRHPALRRRLGVPDPDFVRPQILSSRARPGFDLRPYRLDDEEAWSNARLSSRAWLEPWDSTSPVPQPAMGFRQWLRALDWEALRGQAVVFAMHDGGRFVGEISLGAIGLGALRSAIAGYWVSQQAAGHGYAPLALAMLADWAFFDPTGPRLNRIEVDLLPSNSRSRRVVEKNGLTRLGIRRAWMHVAGQWQDHEVWELLAADVLGVPARQYRPAGRASLRAAGRHPCEERLLANLRQNLGQEGGPRI